MELPERRNRVGREKMVHSSADSSDPSPAAALQTARKQPHDTATHLVGDGRHASDASHPKQSRGARGKDKNKNQDYKAAAATTAGTAAARARLCAEPSAHVNKPIAPSWCAAASSIGTTYSKVATPNEAWPTTASAPAATKRRVTIGRECHAPDRARANRLVPDKAVA